MLVKGAAGIDDVYSMMQINASLLWSYLYDYKNSMKLSIK